MQAVEGEELLEGRGGRIDEEVERGGRRPLVELPWLLKRSGFFSRPSFGELTPFSFVPSLFPSLSFSRRWC